MYPVIGLQAAEPGDANFNCLCSPVVHDYGLFDLLPPMSTALSYSGCSHKQTNPTQSLEHPNIQTHSRKMVAHAQGTLFGVCACARTHPRTHVHIPAPWHMHSRTNLYASIHARAHPTTHTRARTNASTHNHAPARKHAPHMQATTHARTHVHGCRLARLRARTHTRLHACTHARTHSHTHACTNVFTNDRAQHQLKLATQSPSCWDRQ